MVDIFNISFILLGTLILIFPILIFLTSDFFAPEWVIFMVIGLSMIIFGIKWHFGIRFKVGKNYY
jgi:hypothetical protein